MNSNLRQLGHAFLGFFLGASAMFWLPWAMALVFGRAGSLPEGSSARLVGMHIMASLLLSLAWLLLCAARTLILKPPPEDGPGLRFHAILGAMGAGIFYLLYPLFTDSPWVVALVVVLAAGILGGLFLRRRSRAGGELPDWTRIR